MKILLVEDELVIADNLYNALKKQGYQPLRPVINYSQAVQVIEQDQPDFAILDIQLSGQKDGIDIAQYILDHHHFPFIFLTAFGDDKTLERATRVRPAAYLVKPFTKSELKPTIEIAMINYQLRQQEQTIHHKERLSEAEQRVVGLIAAQKTTPQIARELHLSTSTVKNHRHRICVKLELPPSNNALLTWVMQHWPSAS